MRSEADSMGIIAQPQGTRDCEAKRHRLERQAKHLPTASCDGSYSIVHACRHVCAGNTSRQ